MAKSSEEDSEQLLVEALRHLSLPLGSSLRDAALAYRQLASQNHPDRQGNLSRQKLAAARLRMSEINQAYAYLKRRLPDPKQEVGETRGNGVHEAATNHDTHGSRNQSTKRSERIVFQCPVCNRRIRVPKALQGKQGRCTACKEDITVPTHREIRCQNCNKRNRVPILHATKLAICRNCLRPLVFDDSGK